MTESEWLACKEPGKMMEQIMKWKHFGYSRESDPPKYIQVTNRKLKDFVLACRNVADYEFGNKKGWANNLVTAPQVAMAASDWCSGSPDAPMMLKALPLARRCKLLRDIFGNPWKPVTLCGDEPWPHSNAQPGWNGCIPCLRVARDPNVLAIAHSLQSDVRFEDMAVLHDALLDAGCNSEPILKHCLEPLHVRGCWVVEMLCAKMANGEDYADETGKRRAGWR